MGLESFLACEISTNVGTTGLKIELNKKSKKVAKNVRLYFYVSREKITILNTWLLLTFSPNSHLIKT